MAGSRKHLGRGLGLLVVLVACLTVPSASASAADRIFWTHAASPGAISFANLDGSGGGGDLDTTGATVPSFPEGVAIDAAAGRVYWGNGSGTGISFASLAGGGGGDLNTTGATTPAPFGVALDPVAGRIYWASEAFQKISFASLAGSGGGDLSTIGATTTEPLGPAVDRVAGKICWSNRLANKISCANLNGSGGGDLNTGTAPLNDPIGVAVDEATGRIYWANAGSIGFANVDGSGGGGELKTGGATLVSPYGLAIDPAAGRIYWANNPFASISWAKLDNSNVGEDLDTSGATSSAPYSFPAILRAPSGAGAPVVSGGSTPGSTLFCSQGSWAADPVGGHLSWAPSSFAYAWQLGGSDIPGAGGTSIVATKPGSYTCRVTASNFAGSTAQASAAFAVVAPIPNTKITRAKIASAAGRATFRFAAEGEATGFQCKLKQSRRHAKAKFKNCKSPKGYRRLPSGRYLFQVRAVGPGGPDATPAKKKFKIRKAR